MEQAQVVETVKQALTGMVNEDEKRVEVSVTKHDEASSTAIIKVKTGTTTWWVTIYKQRAKA